MYLLLLLFIVWTSDTAAYFTGKNFGKTPLSPNISPKKTVEGAVGGVLAAIVVSFLWNAFQSGPKLPWLGLTLLALFGSVFGILGDLLESTFKRFANVKDSGFILPGHGGLLDRLDGVLLASPVVWVGLYILL
jgi:phosphatidate cytidylyltransferase